VKVDKYSFRHQEIGTTTRTNNLHLYNNDNVKLQIVVANYIFCLEYRWVILIYGASRSEGIEHVVVPFICGF